MTGRSGATAAPSEAALNGFGNDYRFAESLALSTTTSDTFQQKLRLTANGLEGGIYRINWSFVWGFSSPSNSIEIRVEQDDTTLLWDINQEPKDGGSGQRAPAGGFRRLDLAAGNYFWDLDFRRNGLNGTARISDAVFDLFRISD
jgi:hypothetical protein